MLDQAIILVENAIDMASVEGKLPSSDLKQTLETALGHLNNHNCVPSASTGLNAGQQLELQEARQRAEQAEARARQLDAQLKDARLRSSNGSNGSAPSAGPVRGWARGLTPQEELAIDLITAAAATTGPGLTEDQAISRASNIFRKLEIIRKRPPQPQEF